MARIVKKFNDSDTYKPKPGETLPHIASDMCEDWVTWQTIAMFNWGTVNPDEVVRAMSETVGIRLKDVFGAYGALLVTPDKVQFEPDSDLPAEIRLPKAIDAETLPMRKRHEVRVRHSKPAVGVAIRTLDKWFIPETEECDVKFAYSGLADTADKASLEFFGSNYTHCSDWSKGHGKFTEKTEPFDSVPLYSEVAGVKPTERSSGEFKWKGDVDTKDGVLKNKRAGQDKRYVNVAFSPYTAHMRYYKLDGDKKAQVVLRPFWPAFETKETSPAPALVKDWAPNEAGAKSVKLKYKNAADVDGGWLIVKDAAPNDQVVYRRALKGDELKKGDHTINWDGKYDAMALNGVMKGELINDSAESAVTLRQKGYLFRSWPYTFELKTYTRVYKTGASGTDPDPSLIKWKVLETSKLERGLIQIYDGKGKVVWQKALKKDQLTKDKEHELSWSGRYAKGLKNSKGGTKAIEDDMPYRVQIQAHTVENKPEGLAVAAMHSEVRLYVPKGLYAAEDPRRDLVEAPPAMLLTRGKAWPKPAAPTPADGNSEDARRFFQYSLDKAGYYPGPITGKASEHLNRAIREFKRSVPRDLSAGAGNFTRHPLAAGVINDLTNDMRTCLGSAALSPRWTRVPWADPAKIDGNQHNTDFASDDALDNRLGEPDKKIVLWIDDRQYNTEALGQGTFIGYGPDGVDYFGQTRPAGKALTAAEMPGGQTDPNPNAAMADIAADRGLRNYRGMMTIGDGKVTMDRDEVSQPWVPLRAELRVLSKDDPLYPDADQAKVRITDADKRAAMRRAIGPLRVDWSVHDALYDVSTIDPASYPAQPEPKAGHGVVPEIRTRRFVAGALVAARRTFKRKDDAFAGQFWNCPKPVHEIGKVPADISKYHKEVFGAGDDNMLLPWTPLHHDDEEATASIVHDHIAELKDALPTAGNPQPQKLDENLFADQIGAAGVWFNPAITAGDGYRLRAEVKFKEVGDYKFPNLKVLQARYPVAPQATTCEIRMWRRDTFRGYTKWSPAAEATRWTAATINQIRRQYKLGHVYFTLDGTDNMNTLKKDMATLFDFSDNGDDQATARKFVKWHGADDWQADLSKVKPHQDYLWPWHQENDLGRPNGVWCTGTTLDATFAAYVGQFDAPQWDKLTSAFLYWVHRKFEADGHMRGHLMIDIKDAPKTKIWIYKCSRNAAHRAYLQLMLDSAPAPYGQWDCADCQAETPSVTHQVTRTSGDVGGGVFLAAIGLANGASWLFPEGGDLWAHEIGHHKHMQHASSAPGPQVTQHDSGRNAKVPADAKKINGSVALELGWDRRCLMSYNDRDGGHVLFCGKCVFRIRGWKYGSVVSPADDVLEPT